MPKYTSIRVTQEVADKLRETKCVDGSFVCKINKLIDIAEEEPAPKITVELSSLEKQGYDFFISHGFTHDEALEKAQHAWSVSEMKPQLGIHLTQLEIALIAKQVTDKFKELEQRITNA